MTEEYSSIFHITFHFIIWGNFDLIITNGHLSRELHSWKHFIWCFVSKMMFSICTCHADVWIAFVTFTTSTAFISCWKWENTWRWELHACKYAHVTPSKTKIDLCMCQFVSVTRYWVTNDLQSVFGATEVNCYSLHSIEQHQFRVSSYIQLSRFRQFKYLSSMEEGMQESDGVDRLGAETQCEVCSRCANILHLI